MRNHDRAWDALRQIKVTKDFIGTAEGSVLIECGNTRVVCTATVEEKLPGWLKGKGKGWVTAEYSMLPRATQSRNQREVNKGKPSGRTQEIQRLIGRSLRSVVDLEALGERSIWIDCDVIEADGGTRTASITGGFIALALALKKLVEEGVLPESPINSYVAAVSVGVVDGEARLDLEYEEDSVAEVDMNVIMSDQGEYIEIQGTGEEKPFSKESLNTLLGLAEKGIMELIEIQKQVIEG